MNRWHDIFAVTTALLCLFSTLFAFFDRFIPQGFHMRVCFERGQRTDMRTSMCVGNAPRHHSKALGRGGHFEHRHVYTGAVDTPSAMADVMPM